MRVRRAAARSRSGSPPEDVLRRLRVSFIQRATLVVDGQDEDALVVDIGLRGVFVERATPLPTGAGVTVRFRLPGNERLIEARARVAWRHPADAPRVSARLPPGLGIEFTALSDDDAARVRSFLVGHWCRAPRERQFTREWPESTA